MKKYYGFLVILAFLAISLSACAPQNLGTEQQKCLNNPYLGAGSKDNCLESEVAAKTINEQLAQSSNSNSNVSQSQAAVEPKSTAPEITPTQPANDIQCGHVNDSDGTVWGEILTLGADHTYAAVQNLTGGADYGQPYQFSNGSVGKHVPANAKVCVGSIQNSVIAEVLK